MISGNEADQALSAMRQARMRAQEEHPLPLGYSIAFGLLMAGWIGSPALPPIGRAAAALGFGLGLYGLYRWSRRRTGRWVNGYRAGRTRWVAIAMAVLAAVLMLLSAPPLFDGRPPLPPLAAMAIALVLVTLMDRLWLRSYAADVRDGR